MKGRVDNDNDDAMGFLISCYDNFFLCKLVYFIFSSKLSLTFAVAAGSASQSQFIALDLTRCTSFFPSLPRS